MLTVMCACADATSCAHHGHAPRMSDRHKHLACAPAAAYIGHLPRRVNHRMFAERRGNAVVSHPLSPPSPVIPRTIHQSPQPFVSSTVRPFVADSLTVNSSTNAVNCDKVSGYWTSLEIGSSRDVTLCLRQKSSKPKRKANEELSPQLCPVLPGHTKYCFD